jgi:hypothetical protein
MNFGPWNFSKNIWDSIGISTLKVGVHLGVWVHALTLLGVQMWLLGCTFDPHLSMPHWASCWKCM